MHHTSYFSSIVIPAVLLAFLFLSAEVQGQGQNANQPTTIRATKLIYRQRYDEAVTQLEQVLETEPANSEALTYMATVNMYRDLQFLQAQSEFQKAYQAGGGATFIVNHSHEKFNTDDVVDYCRGWLNLRKNSIEFVPIESNHGFKIAFNQVEEFQRNKLSKKAFHLKFGGKSQNFRGRSNTESEPLLIIALFKSFAQN
jgi:tetratricopeptide (TPR) repeat protein